jgi:hypothetical protein
MKQFICILTILSLVGCTTFKPVEYQEVSLPEIVEVGKTYKFTEVDGSVTEMKVTAVSEKEVTGTLEHGAGKTIQAVDLQSIEVETIDGGKTTLAVIGGIILLPIAIIGIIVACMFGCGY